MAYVELGLFKMHFSLTKMASSAVLPITDMFSDLSWITVYGFEYFRIKVIIYLEDRGTRIMAFLRALNHFVAINAIYAELMYCIYSVIFVEFSKKCFHSLHRKIILIS